MTMKKTGQKTGLFSRVPQFLNWVLYELIGQKSSVVHAYEPLHLHVYVPARSNERFKLWYGQVGQGESTNPKFVAPKDLDLDSFQFVIKQIPTIKTLEFSGWGEPLRNKKIFDIINYAYTSIKAVSTVYSHGHFGTEVYKDILTSHLDTLVINMIGHKPSSYAAITGKPASNFVTLERNLEQFLLVRSHYPQSTVFIEVSMTVDVMSLYQIPEMIRYAETMGVDGIRFENFLGNPREKSLQTIYHQYKKAVKFLESLREEDYRIQVILPTLLDQDMSEHRNCRDPHTTVSLTGALQTSPCSRHLLFRDFINNVWDGEFWNNEQYQWLRKIHSTAGAETKQSVPLPCQNCPKNAAHSPRILNDRVQTQLSKQTPTAKTAMW